jgi:DNA polymerase
MPWQDRRDPVDPSGFRITREHGTWIEQYGIWMTAIYHPSALLRDLTKRPETFVDLLSIRKKAKELSK